MPYALPRRTCKLFHRIKRYLEMVQRLCHRRQGTIHCHHCLVRRKRIRYYSRPKPRTAYRRSNRGLTAHQVHSLRGSIESSLGRFVDITIASGTYSCSRRWLDKLAEWHFCACAHRAFRSFSLIRLLPGAHYIMRSCSYLFLVLVSLVINPLQV